MVEPLEISKEMKESREKAVDRIIERCNEDIRRAVERGEHECLFNCDMDRNEDAPFYREVRKRFEDKGYRIKPTGYIGGVWQRTEDIVW